MAQSDGLVRLATLSANGHPKAKRSTCSRASGQRLPTAPHSRLPQKNSGLFFAPFFTGNLVKNKKQTPSFFKTRKFTIGRRTTVLSRALALDAERSAAWSSMSAIAIAETMVTLGRWGACRSCKKRRTTAPSRRPILDCKRLSYGGLPLTSDL